MRLVKGEETSLNFPWNYSNLIAQSKLLCFLWTKVFWEREKDGVGSWADFQAQSFHLSPLHQVQFSHSVVSNFLRHHGLQHPRLPCPSPTPEACSNSCPSSWWSHPTILSSVVPPPLAQHFQWFRSSHQQVKVLELLLQHQSFQWICRTDFLYDWLVWSPCSPRNSQETSPTSQFKSFIPPKPLLISSLQLKTEYQAQPPKQHVPGKHPNSSPCFSEPGSPNILLTFPSLYPTVLRLCKDLRRTSNEPALVPSKSKRTFPCQESPVSSWDQTLQPSSERLLSKSTWNGD